MHRNEGGLSTLFMAMVLVASSLGIGQMQARADLLDASALSDHGTIKITNDSQFNSTNGVVCGNGTVDAPYVIENHSINASKNHGIWVENTTSHFVIRNCYVEKGSPTKSYDGIRLVNVSNATIINNRLTNNYRNINCYYCDNLTISSNNLTYSNNTNVVLVMDNSRFENNTMAYSGEYSIYAILNNCTINGNRFLNHTVYKSNSRALLALRESYFATISDNFFADSANTPLSIGDSEDFHIMNNTIQNISSQSALYYQNCSRSIINNNTFKNITGDYSTYISRESDNLTIENNSYLGVGDRGSHGLIISPTDSVTIRNNTFSNNYISIQIQGSNASITGNRFENNIYGLTCSGNDNATILDNLFENNSENGLSINDALYLTIQNNTFNNNSASIGFSMDSKYDYYTLNITLNNTSNGKPILYLVNETNVSFSEQYAFACLVGCKNVSLANQSYSREAQGIMTTLCTNVSLSNISGYEISQGIRCEMTENFTVANCAFYGNNTGMIGIGLNQATGIIRTFNNSFFRCSSGISGYKLKNQDIRLFNNTFYNNSGSIIMQDSTEIEIFNNIIEDDSGDALRLYWTKNITFRENLIRRVKQQGMRLYGGDNTTAENNTIMQSDLEGIYLIYSDGCVFVNNTIRNCTGYGINLNESNQTVIYNNYFNNSKNYNYDSLNTNRWNISETAGWNIIGGPMLGGNYWSDYSGSDSDEDGFGDTSLPYGPGDQLPLLPISLGTDLYPPNITDITGSKPTTGDDFTLKASVSDDTMVTAVSVLYWFDGAEAVNASMSMVSGTYRNGTYSLSVKVPSASYKLQYQFFARDLSGKLANSSVIQAAVQDNDPPSIKDNPGTPTTGETYRVNATITDNINVSETRLEYWFDDGKTVNVSLDGSTGYFLADIQVPSNATILKYNLSAMDDSGNRASRPTASIKVVDNDYPELEDNTTTIPVTGANFTFSANATDNVRITSVSVEYWFNNGSRIESQLSLSNGTYTLTIPVATDARTMHYMLFAADSSANRAKLDVVDLLVTDDIPPTILDLTYGTPTTGENFSFYARITDNIGIDWANILYRFDDGLTENVSLTDGPTYALELNIPIDARSVHYVLSASDGSGNRASSPETNLSVRDDDRPFVEDLTGIPYSGEPFAIGCRAADNIGISQVESEYWFDVGNHTRELMEKMGDYRTDLMVPREARVLHYRLTAMDTSGNLNSTSADLRIIDKIAPVLLDRCADPATGENFTFDFTVTENWKIRSLTFEYWFDTGPHTILPYVGATTVRVPLNSTVLHYIVTAMDDSNNSASLQQDRTVRDIIAPQIRDLSGNCTTGDDFQFLVEVVENVAIAEAYLDFRFDDDEWARVPLNRSILVKAPGSAHSLDYSITVNDTSGNSVKAFGHREVLDNDAPVIDNAGWTYTSEGIRIAARVADNIAVGHVRLRYSYDGSSPAVAEMTREGSDFYAIVNISDAGSLGYLIICEDSSGNIVKAEFSVDIRSLLSMKIRDLSGTPTTGDGFPLVINISNPEYNSELTIEYWFDGSGITTLSYAPGFTVTVPDKARKLNYRVTTADICGIRRNSTFWKDVIDNDAPVLEIRVNGTGIAGSVLTLNITASDNMAIRNATIRYWFDAGLNETVLELGPEIANHSLDIELPEMMATIHYSVTVTDTAGNSKEAGKELAINKKAIPPGAGNGIGLPALLVLALAAGLLALTLSAVVYRRMRKARAS